VVAPQLNAKPEPVSRRLTRTLIHPNRKALIRSVLFDPDGKWIAGGGPTSDVAIWDAATGKQLRTIRLPEGYMNQVDPLPSPVDGRTFFLPIQRTRELHVTKEGRPAIRWEVDGEIQVWDLATGRKLPPLRHTPPRGVMGVALSSDGKQLAAVERLASDDGKRFKEVLTLWDVRSRTSRDLAEGRFVPSFAPDDKTLAALFVVDHKSKRSALALWDVASGKRRAVLHEATTFYGAPVFSPEGRYIAARLGRSNGRPPEVKLWEVATGKEIGFFTASEEASFFHQLAFSSDGRRLAAATFAEGKVFLYDVPARKLMQVRDLGKNAGLCDPVFSPDGKWLAVPGQHLPEDVRHILDEDPRELPQPRVFLFDLASDGEPEVVVAPHGFVGRATFSPNGRTLALGGSGRVWLFDMSKKSE
jgi:WD40 repeat protein